MVTYAQITMRLLAVGASLAVAMSRPCGVVLHSSSCAQTSIVDILVLSGPVSVANGSKLPLSIIFGQT
jgi:hypothetical protein